MSYSSRVYRQRNAHAHDEGQKKPFSSKEHEATRPEKKNKAVQAKLSVNKPGDSYEREADAVANSMVNQSSSKTPIQKKQITSVQRLATPVEDEQLATNDARMKKDKDIQEKPVQAMTAGPEKEKTDVQAMHEPNKEEEPAVQNMDDNKMKEDDMTKAPVQKKATNDASTVSPGVATSLQESAGKGSPLPSKTLKEMSAGFGVDFSKVRVHNDNDAAALSNELQAQAFTHGQDIYFNEGKFDPSSAAGKFLLAHELTHVVQQNKGDLQPQVNRQAAPAQNIAGISTPVPAGLAPTPKGEYETVIGGVKVIIKPDIHSKVKGTGAVTKFKQLAGGKITDYEYKNGKITSFTGPTQLVIAIQTIYQKGAKASGSSQYGRGTTATDQAAGDTSLGFHEGSHGTDYMAYLQTNALPGFGGANGMTVKQFKKEITTYNKELKKYFKAMAHASELSTDCVGITIDQLTGSKVCVP